MTELKGVIDCNTIIVGDCDTLLLILDRITRQKVIKKTKDLNNAIDQLDLANLHRILHPATADYTFFSSAHRTFSKIDHVLGHKTSPNKFKIKNIQSIFSGHSGLKLEINSTRKTEKSTNMWKLTLC